MPSYDDIPTKTLIDIRRAWIAEAAPVLLMKRLDKLASKIWTTALEYAHNLVETERAELEHAWLEAVGLADQLAAELDTARATVDRQAAQLAADAETIGQLREALRTQEQALAAALYRANRTETALLALQARVEQIANLLTDKIAQQDDKTQADERNHQDRKIGRFNNRRYGNPP
ncbi:hypothetical protein [Candidatus Methylocalor cossyra]|uniref:KfrA N-terminal DNA-binding domain-containing protein n=1 Tax=Candidatus Methylocalor cossyra TaxID=3108543 RepID=A0ABM9NJS3_9GAMM